MKSILDKVMELSSDERLIGLYNKEELAEAREYGMHLAGKEDLQKGIEETQKQVVSNMYKKNIDIDTICEITELSKEDILKYINDIKEYIYSFYIEKKFLIY